MSAVVGMVGGSTVAAVGGREVPGGFVGAGPLVVVSGSAVIVDSGVAVTGAEVGAGDWTGPADRTAGAAAVRATVGAGGRPGAVSHPASHAPASRSSPTQASRMRN